MNAKAIITVLGASIIGISTLVLTSIFLPFFPMILLVVSFYFFMASASILAFVGPLAALLYLWDKGHPILGVVAGLAGWCVLPAVLFSIPVLGQIVLGITIAAAGLTAACTYGIAKIADMLSSPSYYPMPNQASAGNTAPQAVPTYTQTQENKQNPAPSNTQDNMNKNNNVEPQSASAPTYN